MGAPHNNSLLPEGAMLSDPHAASTFADRSAHARFKSLGIGNRERKINLGSLPCSKTHFKLRQSPLVVRQQAALFVSQSQQQNSSMFSKRIPAMISRAPAPLGGGAGDYIYTAHTNNPPMTA